MQIDGVRGELFTKHGSPEKSEYNKLLYIKNTLIR